MFLILEDIGGEDVDKHAEPLSIFRNIQPFNSMTSIFGEFQQECLLMTAVGYVPDMTRQAVSVGSGHVTLALK